MTQPKEKTKFGKFLQNIGLPILRAGLKQVPVIGTPIAEIVTNLTAPKGQPKKHSYLSISVQCVIASAVILDLLLNKGANLKAILDIVGLFPREVAPV